MPTIATFKCKIRIVINTKDHDPAHFHVVLNNKMKKSAKIEIGTWKILREGEFSKNDLKKLIKFAKEFKTELKQAWKECHGKK